MEEQKISEEKKLELIKIGLMGTLNKDKQLSKKIAKKDSNKVKHLKNTEKEKSKKNSKKLKKQKLKLNEYEDIETETDITSSRKWDDKKKTKNDSITKGKFSKEEETLILDSFCEFGYSNNLDEEQMLKFITEKQTKSEKSIWNSISEALPNRTVQSIHNFCHRKFNPCNYKGPWTVEEEKKLLVLYEEHKSKWNLIAKELDRTPTNVKDKFKQLGGKNYLSRSNEFTLNNCLKLLKYIEGWIIDNNDSDSNGPDSVSHKYKIFKFDYKFRNDLESKVNLVYFLMEDKNKFLIDSSIKESPSRVIIRNILKLIVDFYALERIIEDKVEISWSFISDKFVIFSAVDCKNNFDKIIRDFDLLGISQIRKDLKMLKHLLKCEYDSFDEVNFSLIKNKRTPDENKKKLEELVKFSDIYSVKTFNDILQLLKDQLEKNLLNGKNEHEQFESEIVNNKSFDFLRIYRDFLNKKRARK